MRTDCHCLAKQVLIFLGNKMAFLCQQAFKALDSYTRVFIVAYVWLINFYVTFKDCCFNLINPRRFLMKKE